jgi:hypothetical protein
VQFLAPLFLFFIVFLNLYKKGKPISLYIFKLIFITELFNIRNYKRMKIMTAKATFYISTIIKMSVVVGCIDMIVLCSLALGFGIFGVYGVFFGFAMAGIVIAFLLAFLFPIIFKTYLTYLWERNQSKITHP